MSLKITFGKEKFWGIDIIPIQTELLVKNEIENHFAKIFSKVEDDVLINIKNVEIKFKKEKTYAIVSYTFSLLKDEKPTKPYL